MLAALELASIVRNPGALAVEHFARGDLEMQQVVADRGAKLVGKPLFELEMPVSVRIASIKRDDKLIIPTRNDSIIHDDLVTVIGQTEQVSYVCAGLEAGERKVIKVVIMGGGHTALSLARRLRSHTFRLTIIERDQKRCQFLASYLPSAMILHGDGTNLAFLQEERIESADVFISTTSSDEANIMSAIQAKDLGVSKVLVVIHRPDYGNLAEKLGIDKAISPRVVMANEILALLQKGDVCSLAQLNNGEAEILQLAVRNADFIGPCLRDLPLPEGTLVLTGHRGRDLIMPTAETCFQVGDVILVICHRQQRKKVIRLVVGNV
jgi:trk system potassium uptake protein TrkA